MLRQFFYFGASRLLVFGGQLLLIPIAVTQLGAPGYGLYNLMLQVAQLVRLVALQGVAQVLIRDSSRLVASHGESRLYYSSLVMVIACLLLAFSVIIPLRPIITSTFHLSHDQIWLALAMAIALVYFGLKQVFIYNRNLSAYTVWDTAQTLGATLALILAGAIIPTVDAYASAFTVVTMSVAIVMLHYPGAGWPQWHTVRELALEMRRYGFPLMLGEGLSWLVAVADRFQIAAMLNLEQTGVYVAAYQLLVAPASMLGFAVALVIQPSAFASDTRSYQNRMERAATLLVILSILYSIPALLLGKQVFAIFFRHQAEIDTLLILFLVLAGVANSFLYLEIIAGKYARRASIILVAQAFAALLILVGNWLLLPHIGITAAAMTSLAAYLLQIAIIRRFIGKDYHFRYFSLTAAHTLLHRLMDDIVLAFRFRKW